MKNLLLFITPAIIWGATWISIKFQLGVVDPLVSIVYRFFMAGLILIVYTGFTGKKLKFTLRQHGLMMLLGFLLFGVNYWLVYLAELTLASGLVAVVFSTIIFLNILFGALLLKSPISLKVSMGAVLGFAGVALIFKEQLLHFTFSSQHSIALLLALLGAVFASLGNITSAYVQKHKIPVLQSNGFGMLYGALFMLLISLSLHKPFSFEPTLSYIFSLLYLSLFGSVIAFGSYLTLLGRIGADRAGYITLVIPMIALLISTLFEGYQWTPWAMAGVAMIIFGNIMVLRRIHRG